jgi:Bacterial protein of unknown function (DUF839)
MNRNLHAMLLAASTSMIATAALAGNMGITNLEAKNASADGVAVPNSIAAELNQAIVAKGSMKLENPTDLIGYYGFDNDGPLSPAAGAVQSKENRVEATKTEPDKNTYLVLAVQKGPDASYNYGTHFLFQGHENGVRKDDKPQGYFTRINLDADEAHRVTLMATKDTSGNPLVFIDGSTWNPFASHLLLTGEEGLEGGLWQATADFPSVVEDLRDVAGIASFEGVQIDKDGNLWLVEDEGGKKGDVNKHARQPNSFLYRLTPTDKADLKKGGKLEVLQVTGKDGQPIAFHDGEADADITAPAQKDLYAYGTVLKTKWVLLHDTAVDGNTPFESNKLAKAKGGTPMKRPENGMFRPGKDFTEFYFTATGDTNGDTEVGSDGGGFGGIFRLTQTAPSAAEGELNIVYRSDMNHACFDNLAFWDSDNLAIVEDCGEKLHGQRKLLDAGYLIDVAADFSKGDVAAPVRFVTAGRDEASTLDATLIAVEDNGFQNDGDNELTGIHVSNGDATVEGLLGTKVPTPFKDGWRVFYTRQHGNNETYEITGK